MLAIISFTGVFCVVKFVLEVISDRLILLFLNETQSKMQKRKRQMKDTISLLRLMYFLTNRKDQTSW